MTAPTATTEHGAGPVGTRVRAMATYPVRLGPRRVPFEATPFSRLALVHACSSGGDALVTVALAGSVFVSVSLDAARGRTALGLVCTVLPFLVVGPFIGPVVDRIRGGRRFVVLLTGFGRAGACILMAMWVHGLWLFPAAFLSLVCSKTYLVARASLVPSVVDSQDQLVEANAKLAVGSSIATSVVALAGAGLYKAFGSAAVLRIDVLLFVASALLALRLPAARTDGAEEGIAGDAGIGGGSPAGASAGTPAGVSAGTPAGVSVGAPAGASTGAPVPVAPSTMPPGGLALAAVTMAVMRGTAGFMTALVVFAFRHDGAPLFWYGLVGVASVVGNLAGATLAPLVRAATHEQRIIVACALSIGGMAVICADLGGEHHWPAALILAVVVGVAASIGKLAFDSLVQREARDAVCGRLFAHYEAGFQLAWVVAALLPTLVALSLLAGFWIVAVASFLGIAVFGWGLARAHRGTLPRWWPGVGSGDSGPSAAPYGTRREGSSTSRARG